MAGFVGRYVCGSVGGLVSQSWVGLWVDGSMGWSVGGWVCGGVGGSVSRLVGQWVDE